MSKADFLLPRYLRDVLRHWVGLLMGAVMTGGTWLLDHLVAAGWLRADWWVHPTPLFYLTVVSAGLSIAQFMAWRELRVERDSETQGHVSIQPFLSPLTHVWSELNHQPTDRLIAALSKRTFALLRVRNEGLKNLVGVVAQCSVDESRDEIRCLWSKESGERYVPGGRHAADLNVGDSQALLIAQAFGESELWVRLPKWGEPHELPFEARSSEEGVLYLSPSGDSLNLGREIELAIRFRAEGLDQTERFLLGFEADGPKITIRPRPAGNRS